MTIGTFGKYLYKEINKSKLTTHNPTKQQFLSTSIDIENFFCIFLMVPITVYSFISLVKPSFHPEQFPRSSKFL